MILQVRADYVEMLCPLTGSSHTVATMDPPGKTWQKLGPAPFLTTQTSYALLSFGKTFKK